MTNSTRFLFPQIQVVLFGPPWPVGLQTSLQFSINPHLCRRLCDNFRLQLQSSCLTNQPSLKDASEHWGGVNCGHLTKDSLRKTETMAFGPSMGRTMAMIPILVPSIRSTMSAQCRRCWSGAGTTILRTWELPSRCAYFPLQFVQLTSLLTTPHCSPCLLCEVHIF